MSDASSIPGMISAPSIDTIPEIKQQFSNLIEDDFLSDFEDIFSDSDQETQTKSATKNQQDILLSSGIDQSIKPSINTIVHSLSSSEDLNLFEQKPFTARKNTLSAYQVSQPPRPSMKELLASLSSSSDEQKNSPKVQATARKQRIQQAPKVTKPVAKTKMISFSSSEEQPNVQHIPKTARKQSPTQQPTKTPVKKKEENLVEAASKLVSEIKKEFEFS
jgi:hypothetical protein